MKKDYKKFPINIYNLSETNAPTILQGRVRIFYKGLNRNGSYITPEFGERLASTLSYTPIKGIFNKETGDFEGHGETQDGKIYGVVPKDHNFSWELHRDTDGILREYACADVLIWDIYDESRRIVDKGQSMELYGPSIQGKWYDSDDDSGMEGFVFTEAAFLGLQILGDEVEPCFEGAAFFSHVDEFERLISLIKKAEVETSESQGGTMNKDNKKVEAFEVEDKVTEVEENSVGVDESTPDVDTKEEINADLGNNDEAEVVDQSAEDKEVKEEEEEEEKVEEEEAEVEQEAAEESIEEPVEEVAEEVEEEVEEVEEAVAEIEIETEHSLKEEIENLKSKNLELEEQVATYKLNEEKISDEIASLRQFKSNVEMLEKQAVVEKYNAIGTLPEEVIADYTNRLAEYNDIAVLEKDLAFELVKAQNPFGQEAASFAKIPNRVAQGDEQDLLQTLSAYKKDRQTL